MNAECGSNGGGGDVAAGGPVEPVMDMPTDGRSGLSSGDESVGESRIGDRVSGDTSLGDTGLGNKDSCETGAEDTAIGGEGEEFSNEADRFTSAANGPQIFDTGDCNVDQSEDADGMARS